MLNISLPDDLQTWLEQRAIDSGASAPEEYVVRLLREDRARDRIADIDDALVAALNGEPATPMTSEDWTRLRAEAVRRSTGSDAQP